MSEEQSEFGKGLVICLVKFAEHWERLIDDVRRYKELAKERPDLYSESSAVEIAMNGAGDHLYDIEVPESMKGTEIESMVEELQDKGLKMRLSMQGERYVFEDAAALFQLARDISLAIDKRLGLDAEIGKW